MTAPHGLKFTSTHEWIRIQGKKIVVGITDFAQSQLHGITSVELPEPDPHHHYETGEDVGVIESTKAAADFFAPVPGLVITVNHALLDNPELVNHDPYGAGWLFEMQPDDMAEVIDLMDQDEYESSLPEEEPEEE